MDLQNKTVLITGGTRRLGLAMAEAVAKRGANIALHYRSSIDECNESLAKLRKYNIQADGFQADLLNTKEIYKMLSAVTERFNTIDVLINNAAIFERKPFLELTEDDWDRTINTNLKASFLCAQQASMIMLPKKSGKIINMACVGGFKPWPTFLPYSISKAGVIMLTKTLALALTPHIQVNAIAPGPITFDEINQHKNISTNIENQLIECTPKDIVHALTYFLDSDQVTGEILIVDGGRYLS